MSWTTYLVVIGVISFLSSIKKKKTSKNRRARKEVAVTKEVRYPTLDEDDPSYGTENYSVDSAKELGDIGEEKVANILSELDPNHYKVLNKVLFQGEGISTHQIDHIIVSSYGIFVIETKNYKGVIYGNSEGKNWTQFLNTKKYSLYNPIKQNLRHVYVLQELLSEFGQLQFIPIVVFADSAKLKIDAELDIVNMSKLLETIDFHDEEILMPEEVSEIFNKLSSLNIQSKESEIDHIQNKKNLLSLVDDDICPRCSSPLIVKKGKYGEFKACKKYPECTFRSSTKKLEKTNVG